MKKTATVVVLAALAAAYRAVRNTRPGRSPDPGTTPVTDLPRSEAQSEPQEADTPTDTVVANIRTGDQVTVYPIAEWESEACGVATDTAAIVTGVVARRTTVGAVCLLTLTDGRRVYVRTTDQALLLGGTR